MEFRGLVSERERDWEILIKSKLWPRLERTPSLLMRARWFWNVSFRKHICMQTGLHFNMHGPRVPQFDSKQDGRGTILVM